MVDVASIVKEAAKDLAAHEAQEREVEDMLWAFAEEREALRQVITNGIARTLFLLRIHQDYGAAAQLLEELREAVRQHTFWQGWDNLQNLEREQSAFKDEILEGLADAASRINETLATLSILPTQNGIPKLESLAQKVERHEFWCEWDSLRG